MYTFITKQKAELLGWAQELETTSLPQTHGFLHDSLGFCCLGILCQMQAGGTWVRLNNENVFTFQGKAAKNLPSEDQQRLGLSQKFVPYGVTLEDAFTVMNDKLRFTFTQIAAEIRALVDTGDFTPDTLQQVYQILVRST